MKDVAGKVAFITGGSSGIGLGIAQAFADAGMKVVITYRTQTHLDEAMQCLEGVRERIHAIRVDVTDRSGLERAAEETVQVFGRIHVLVNNAGTQLTSPLGATSYEQWDRLIGVNVNGVFNCVHAFLPHIRAHGEGGQIITTASIVGLFVLGRGGYGAYFASKFAVVGLTEALRAELADSNIGVSVFCPGMVRSNLEPALKDHPIAADPLEIGRLVLRGMQNNDLYILTHPEFEPFIRMRHEALVAALPKELQPSAARVAKAQSLLQGSIYTAKQG
jgi:NAD(P)-dependent dehydrogenase (short-subunit alcohol dehydrogenase family)